MALKDAIGGKSSPEVKIPEILELDVSRLKKKFSQSKIVVIPYGDIDVAGERGKGPQKFSESLRILRKAWQKLCEAGFTHFLFVSDHGYLLVDPDPFRRKKLRHGRPIDNNRRHIITEIATNQDEEVRVRLRDLNYKISRDLHLVMPEGATLFENRFSAKNFAHGGNSLQERVIPVLQVICTQKSYPSDIRYNLRVSNIDSSGPESFALTLKVERNTSQYSLDALIADKIEVEIVPVDLQNAQIHIQHAFGGGEYRKETLLINEKEELHIVFSLEGDSVGASRLQIRLPHEEAEPVQLDEYFRVHNPEISKELENIESELVKSKKTVPEENEIIPHNWLDNIDDPNARKIMDYLADHGSISEEETSGLLGGSRKYRKFRRNLELYTSKAPFSVRVENVGGTTRLVREGGN